MKKLKTRRIQVYEMSETEPSIRLF